MLEKTSKIAIDLFVGKSYNACMKFTTTLKDGTWIGGFMVRRSELNEMLDEMRDRATVWHQPLIATRIDKVGRGEQYIIKPR